MNADPVLPKTFLINYLLLEPLYPVYCDIRLRLMNITLCGCFWSPGYLSPTDVLINNKLSEECVSSASLLSDYRDKRAFEVSILIQRHFIR